MVCRFLHECGKRISSSHFHKYCINEYLNCLWFRRIMAVIQKSNGYISDGFMLPREWIGGDTYEG